mgnify:CR=1 FL=1
MDEELGKLRQEKTSLQYALDTLRESADATEKQCAEQRTTIFTLETEVQRLQAKATSDATHISELSAKTEQLQVRILISLRFGGAFSHLFDDMFVVNLPSFLYLHFVG